MSFSSVLILKPSASPVWLPCEGWGVGLQPPGRARAGWAQPTYVVEEVSNLQDQLAEDRQLVAGEQACGRGRG